MRSALFLNAVLLASACASEEPRTQVMAVVDADEGVRRDTARLRIVVRSGVAFEEVRLDQTIGGEGRPISWPVRIALVPQDADASRTFEVEAEALSTTNVRNGIVRARSGYVPRRTKELALLLEDCCRAVECTAEQTCRGCACASKDVPPESLPDLVERVDAGAQDAGQDDASIEPRDAGRDSSVAPHDAGRDAMDAGPPCTLAPCAPTDLALGANTTRDEVCGLENALVRDGSFAGLVRVELDLEELDGVAVTSCVTADFGEFFDRAFVSVVGRRSDLACDLSCSGDFCGTEVAIAVLVSESSTGPWVRRDEYFGSMEATEQLVPVDSRFRFVMVCRGGAMTSRGHVEIDSVAVTRR